LHCHRDVASDYFLFEARIPQERCEGDWWRQWFIPGSRFVQTFTSSTKCFERSEMKLGIKFFISKLFDSACTCKTGNRRFRSQLFNDETLLEKIPSLFASLVGRSRIKNALCSTKSLQNFLYKNFRGGYKRSHCATMRARACGIGLGALIWFGGNPVNDQRATGSSNLEPRTMQTQPARSVTTDRAPALSHRSLPIAAISRRRARASRDITVPIGTSVVSAISR